MSLLLTGGEVGKDSDKRDKDKIKDKRRRIWKGFKRTFCICAPERPSFQSRPPIQDMVQPEKENG